MFQRLIAWIKSWFTGASAKAEVKAQQLDEKLDNFREKAEDRIDTKVDGIRERMEVKVEEAKDRTQDHFADRVRDYGRDEPVKTVHQIEEVQEIKAEVVAQERAADVFVPAQVVDVTREPFVFPTSPVHVQKNERVVHAMEPTPAPVQVEKTERVVRAPKPKREGVKSPRKRTPK